jgi:hypothetical protein
MSDLPNLWINLQVTFGEGCYVSREGNVHKEILMNFIHHANLLIKCEK